MNGSITIPSAQIEPTLNTVRDTLRANYNNNPYDAGLEVEVYTAFAQYLYFLCVHPDSPVNVEYIVDEYLMGGLLRPIHRRQVINFIAVQFYDLAQPLMGFIHSIAREITMAGEVVEEVSIVPTDHYRIMVITVESKMVEDIVTTTTNSEHDRLNGMGPIQEVYDSMVDLEPMEESVLL